MNKKIIIIIVLLLAFIGVVYGVYANKRKPSTMDINLHTESNSTVNNVSLKSSWLVANGQLTIDYQIENKSGKDIFVINKLPQQDSKSLNDHYGYASVENGNLNIVVGTSPALGVREVIAVVPEGYTKVSKGESADFSIQLPLPIQEQNFYDDTHDASKFTNGEVSRANLHVEYKEDQGNIATKEISNEVNITLPVQVRIDRFSRYGHTFLK